MKNSIRRYLNIFFTIVFLYFAYLQLNDPDPVKWVVIYLIASTSCILYAFEKMRRRTLLYQIIILGIFFLRFIPSIYQMFIENPQEQLMQAMNDGKLYVEETREGLGILIVLLVTTGNYFLLPSEKEEAVIEAMA